MCVSNPQESRQTLTLSSICCESSTSIPILVLPLPPLLTYPSPRIAPLSSVVPMIILSLGTNSKIMSSWPAPFWRVITYVLSPIIPLFSISAALEYKALTNIITKSTSPIPSLLSNAAGWYITSVSFSNNFNPSALILSTSSAFLSIIYTSLLVERCPPYIEPMAPAPSTAIFIVCLHFFTFLLS